MAIQLNSSMQLSTINSTLNANVTPAFDLAVAAAYAQDWMNPEIIKNGFSTAIQVSGEKWADLKAWVHEYAAINLCDERCLRVFSSHYAELFYEGSNLVRLGEHIPNQLREVIDTAHANKAMDKVFDPVNFFRRKDPYLTSPYFKRRAFYVFQLIAEKDPTNPKIMKAFSELLDEYEPDIVIFAKLADLAGTPGESFALKVVEEGLARPFSMQRNCAQELLKGLVSKKVGLELARKIVIQEIESGKISDFGWSLFSRMHN